jgi:serine/threonine-protein kinase HipA
MSKRETKRHLLVFADWKGMDGCLLMGTLHSDLVRGKEVFSFEYEENWIKSEYNQMLDPDLSLYSGMHFISDEKPNFGLFLDSSPDRWGRILMRKREALLARSEGRPEQTLLETDYLLGVYDGHRMGALRFKLDKEGPFLNDNRELASPPWTSIRELEEISLRLEDDEAVNDPDYPKWLNMLMAPGSSLGGARPKASVVDLNKHLWIAKFPSSNDPTDIGGWEVVTYELARTAGINMAECQARKFSGRHHTFLTMRFDRTAEGERIHFASAMTLLGYSDGQNHQAGVSYLDLVDFITSNGANADKDLEQLWRRIVFNICVSNTDDHLRNHGFLLSREGWILSPAYDLNPNETGMGLSLNISADDNSLDLELALAVSGFFRLSKERAGQIAEEVTSAVKSWRVPAKKYGISGAEQDLKARAFSRSY